MDRDALTALLLVSSLVGVPAGSANAESADDDPPTAAFVPVRPCRLIDTRGDDPEAPRRPLRANTSIDVDVAGECGVPDHAVAAALTATVVSPQGAGYAVLYPDGSPPDVSTVNYRGGDVVANLQLTRLADGGVRAYTLAPAHLVVDVTGYFRTVGDGRSDDGSGRYVPTAPERVLDTRSGDRPAGRSVIRVDAGVPDDATAVAVNLTTADTVGPDYFTAYAAGQRRPNASVLNVDGPFQSRAAAAVVPVEDGEFDVYTRFGNHIVVDVLGYFTGATDERSDDGLFVPIDPVRLVDTRGAAGASGGPRLWAGGAREFAVPGELGVDADDVAALAVNATVTATEDAGFVTLAAAGTRPPATSTVNHSSAQQTVANASIVGVSTRGIRATASESTHVVIDVTGWFTGTPVRASGDTPANNPPADRKVTIITDSAIAGVRWNGGLEGLQGFVVDHRMESCRRLVMASCRGREGYTPRNVVSEIRTLTDVGPDDILVIGTGYDDWWQRFSGDFDTVIEAARQQGFHHIAWTTYRPDVSYHGLGEYYALMNEVLWAKVASGAYPEVRIWDFATYTAGAQGWFTSDGIHLTRLGAWAVADWLSRHVRAFDDRPCVQPWAPGADLENPCPNPDPLPSERGFPDIVGLYNLG